MIQSQVILHIIRLSFSGIAAFLAIAVWGKTRDAAWLSLVAGAVTGYAALVYETLVALGITLEFGGTIFGIPFATLLFAVVPSFFFILAFILMLARRH